MAKKLTIKEITEILKNLGVEYDEDAKNEELIALYESLNEVTIDDFKVLPFQSVKVVTKNGNGDLTQGEIELDTILNDELVIKLQEENAALKASLANKDAIIEEKSLEIKALKEAQSAEAENNEPSISEFGTGNNVVSVSTSIGVESRMRAGFVFTRKINTYYLSDDELESVKNDQHLVIHNISKRQD